MPLVLPFPDIDPALVSVTLFGHRAGDPLVRARLHRRAAPRLALRRGALPAAGALGRRRADAAGAGRRPADLDDPRGDPRRPARLRALLPAGVLRREPARDPRGLARRHVVPRRPPRRGRRRHRLQPAGTASASSASATRWRRRRRSASSSGGSPTSSTPSSGAGRRPRPGRWSSPARRRRPARPTGPGPAPGTRRSSTRPASKASCSSLVLALAIRAGALARPGRVFGLFLDRLRAGADRARGLPPGRRASS